MSCVSECGDAMSGRSRLSMPMGVFGVLEGLAVNARCPSGAPLSVLLGSAMGVSATSCNSARPLVVLVM